MSCAFSAFELARMDAASPYKLSLPLARELAEDLCEYILDENWDAVENVLLRLLQTHPSADMLHTLSKSELGSVVGFVHLATPTNVSDFSVRLATVAVQVLSCGLLVAREHAKWVHASDQEACVG